MAVGAHGNSAGINLFHILFPVHYYFHLLLLHKFSVLL